MKKIATPESKPETADDATVDETGAVDTDGEGDVPAEYGGPRGKEPTRYGDWERNGRCIDF